MRRSVLRIVLLVSAKVFVVPALAGPCKSGTTNQRRRYVLLLALPLMFVPLGFRSLKQIRGAQPTAYQLRAYTIENCPWQMEVRTFKDELVSVAKLGKALRVRVPVPEGRRIVAQRGAERQ